MKPRVRSALAVVFALGLAFSARAADDSEVIFPSGSTEAVAPARTTGGTLNSVSLAAGLILAGVGGWYVWRNRRTVPNGREVRALAIDETRSLGNRQYLVVASHEGRRFLLGVCPGQITFLSALPDASSRDPSVK